MYLLRTVAGLFLFSNYITPLILIRPPPSIKSRENPIDSTVSTKDKALDLFYVFKSQDWSMWLSHLLVLAQKRESLHQFWYFGLIILVITENRVTNGKSWFASEYSGRFKGAFYRRVNYDLYRKYYEYSNYRFDSNSRFQEIKREYSKIRATQDSLVKGNVFDLIEQNLHCIHKEVKTRKHGKGEWVNTRELYNLMVSTTMVNLTCLSIIMVL